MSGENVELVRTLYTDLDGVDLVALVKTDAWTSLSRAAHPDFEASADPEQPGLGGGESRGTLKGTDAFVSAWRDWLGAFESYWLRAEEYVALPDDRVLVMVENRAITKTDRVEVVIRGGAIWTVEDGMIRRGDLFLDRGRAYKAAGLSE
jgi:hypothetical protein